MLNEEQEYINLIFNHLQNGNIQAMENLVSQIDSRFKRSIPLNYYIAYFYEKVNRLECAIDRFKRCIDLNPYFVYPYFHLANYYLQMGDHSKLEELLTKIFGKKTTDLKTNVKREFRLEDQIQVVNMLGPTYMRTKNYSKAIPLYRKGLEFLQDYTPAKSFNSPDYIQNFKTFSLALGESFAKIDPCKSTEYYLSGLLLDDNEDNEVFVQLNKRLFSGFALTLHYADVNDDYLISILKKATSKVDHMYLSESQPHTILQQKNKIRIGYMSPDFNRNAVGLFVTPLLKNFDRSKFEVFVYYNNGSSDQFTELFRSLPDIIWTNISSMHDLQVHTLMKNDHQLDILVDLIASGSQNRLELIGMRPAPYIINYLGYPSTAFFSAYTHRIVDNFTDPITQNSFHESIHCEKLIRLPRTFLCFNLHSTVKLPILEQTSSTVIKIGIINKSNKWSTSIKDTWLKILNNNQNVISYIKEDESGDSNIKEFGDHPRIKTIPFQETLEGYLSIFNDLDFCLDATPYSGTTTTCTSLLMGVPVFTIYNPNENPHVSNVSGSILNACGLTQFIANNHQDYIQKVGNYIKILENLSQTQKLQNKIDTRDLFLKAMDPDKFMKEYENAIFQLK